MAKSCASRASRVPALAANTQQPHHGGTGSRRKGSRTRGHIRTNTRPLTDPGKCGLDGRPQVVLWLAQGWYGSGLGHRSCFRSRLSTKLPVGGHLNTVQYCTPLNSYWTVQNFILYSTALVRTVCANAGTVSNRLHCGFIPTG